MPSFRVACSALAYGAALAGAMACGQPASPSGVALEPSPGPPPSTAASAEPPATPKRELFLVEGAIADVSARKVVAEPTTDPIRTAAIADTTVYVRVGAVATPQELRAYEIDRGRLRWSVTLTDERGRTGGTPPEVYCTRLAAGPAGVFCVTSRGVSLFAAADGARSEVISNDRVEAIEPLGDRIVVLRSGATSCTNIIRASAGRCIDADIVEAIDAKTGESVARRASGAIQPRNLSFRTQPFASPAGFQSLMPRAGELCALSTSARSLSGGATQDNLDVDCFSEALASRFSLHERLEGAKLQLLHASARWVVVTNMGQGPPSFLVDLEKGVLQTSTVAVTAVIADEQGKIDALVATRKLIELSDSPRFDLPQDLDGELRGLRAKDAIVLLARNPASKSAEIRALDAKTGAERWRGSIELLPAFDRRAWSSIDLRLDRDAAVVSGLDRAQAYLAIFRMADGKPLLEVVRRR